MSLTSAEQNIKDSLARLCSGITPELLAAAARLPPREGVNHAPKRSHGLDDEGLKTMYKNALRYIPREHQATYLAIFKEEFATFGHIYMHSFRPNYSVFLGFLLFQL